MHNVPYSQLKDYELLDKTQDIRGWPVQDGAGASLGTVQELIVDTDRERVTSLVLDSGRSVPARDVILADHKVLFGTNRATAGTTGTTGTARTDTAGERVLPIVEEALRIGKRDVAAGAVKVQTHVVSRPVEQDVQLRKEHISVERRPVNREITAADRANLQDQTIEVTARSEEAVVAKVARVVEEIVVRKDVAQKTERIRDNVKHTEVSIDDGTTANDAAYRQHFGSRYGQSGYTYDQYAPAYRFGHHMRGDARFQGKTWNDVEPQARTAWEERNPGTWESFKEAIQHAWMKVTGS